MRILKVVVGLLLVLPLALLAALYPASQVYADFDEYDDDDLGEDIDA